MQNSKMNKKSKFRFVEKKLISLWKLDKEIYDKKVDPALQLTPMTLEGCFTLIVP